MQQTDPTIGALDERETGHARLTRVACVSCGVVELVPGTPVPGYLCAPCEAEQE